MAVGCKDERGTVVVDGFFDMRIFLVGRWKGWTEEEVGMDSGIGSDMAGFESFVMTGPSSKGLIWESCCCRFLSFVCLHQSFS